MSKDLRTSVRLETKSAVKSLDNLEKKINAVQKAIDRTSNNSTKLNTAINKATTTANKLNVANEKAANSAAKINKNYQKSNSTLTMLAKKVRALASAYLGVMGAKALITTSDTITSAENRLNNMNNGDTKATQLAMDKMYTSANKVRMGYADMMSNVSKSMTLAEDAFQGNIDNAIRFQEIMSEAYTLGGASAAEQSSSMYQMIQALGSGILQGDELRSVREGAPLAYKEIERFAQGVYKTEESLKDLASQGKITSDMVVAAIMNAGDKMDKAFEDTSMTFAQAWQKIKNTATKAFEPLMQKMNDFLNSDGGKLAIEGITSALVVLANVMTWVVSIFSSFFNWCADNWYWLQYIVASVAICLGIYFGILAAKAIWAGLTMFWSFLTSLSPLYIWILMIGVLVGAIVWLANTAISGCNFIVMALLMVAVALAILSVLTQAWWLMWVALAIIVVAAIIAFLEEVVGGVYWLGATCYNIGVGFLNAIIQAVYSIFVDPIAGIIEWFVNAFNGGFNGILGAASNAIGQLVSMFLGGLKIITQAIDAVGGTNLTAKITGWQNSAKSWGKNSSATTYSVETPQLKRISATEAYAKGAAQGAKWESSINEFGNNLKDKISGFSLGGGLSNFGLGAMGTLGTTLPNTQLGTGAFNTPNLGDLGKGVGNIDDNTGSMADSMELAEDDLEYLRKVAEMEWKKEFTTANITVDMSNYNTINGDGDLDGIVTRLADKLYEELDYVANGVYV